METGVKHDQRAVNEIVFSYKARVGVAVFSITALTLTCLSVFRVVEALRPYIGWCAGGLGVLGLVIWFASLRSFSRSDAAEKILKFYRRPSFWSGCLIMAAVIISVVATRLFPILAEDQPPPQPVTEVSVEFPELPLTGVVLNGTMSSAIIDGRTVMIGENIEKVTLVRVCPDWIIAGMDGGLRCYHMGRSSPSTCHTNDPVCGANPEPAVAGDP